VVTTVGPSGESTSLACIELTLTGDALATKSFSALSDTHGHYHFDHLSAGKYQLEVRAKGFEPFDQTVLLGRGEVRLENVVLHLEVVVQKVDVHDQASQVATEGMTPATQLSDQKLQALPWAEQKFKAVLPLVPRVVRTRDGKLNIKGEAENQGMLLVDSVQAVDPVTGNFSTPIPLDAVQKVHVEKAPYDSECGGFSGGLTAIDTKPPSGSWHYGVMDFIPGFRGKAGHAGGADMAFYVGDR
jgi:hypothetical protein